MMRAAADAPGRIAVHRSKGLVVVAVIFALFALNAWAQVFRLTVGWDTAPDTLLGLQVACGTAATMAALGAWQRRRWAPWAAALYGIVAGGMIASLGLILGLPSEATRGLLLGAALLLAFGGVSAWYLARR